MLRPMPRPSAETVSSYLRIARSAHETLSATADQLNLPLSRVTNALLYFSLSPYPFRSAWRDMVTELRSNIDAGSNAVCLHDFSAREWDTEKHAVYKMLEEAGLVEDFNWRRSLRSERVLCSFKVSDAGRVIAQVFKRIGATEEPSFNLEAPAEAEMTA